MVIVGSLSTALFWINDVFDVDYFASMLRNGTYTVSDTVTRYENNFDGFYWCTKIRQKSNIPIIFISARESGMDQIRALESGGDDYITKPFEYEVVIAKIKSHLRRCYGEYAPKLNERIVELDGLKFYLKPDFGKIKEAGLGEVVFAAMGQAFFTLSIGIGSLAIFGSYIGKERK